MTDTMQSSEALPSTRTGSVSNRPTDSPTRAPTLICNGFADDNRGGAALTIATIEALRAAGTESIDLLALSEDLDSYQCTRRWDPDLRIRTRAEVGVAPTRARLAVALLLALAPGRLVRSPLGGRLARAAGRYLVPEVARLGAVVLKPGYVLVTRDSAGSLASLVSTTTPLIAGWALGVPTVGIGHSVVISGHDGNRWERLSSKYVRRLLRKMTAISVRDEASLADVADAIEGAPTDLRMFPDVALMYPWHAPEVTSAAERSILRFGIAAGHGAPGPSPEQYVEAVSRLAGGRPAEVRIIQQSTDLRDIDRAEAIRQLLVRRGIMARTLRPPPEILGSIELWGDVDMAITARMHAAIFSIICGTPVRLLEGDTRKAMQVLGTAGLDRVLSKDLDTVACDFSGESYEESVAAARAAWPEFVDWLAPHVDPERRSTAR